MDLETLNNGWNGTRERIVERDGGECAYCCVGRPIAQLDVHHITPISEGGSDNDENLITICKRCHRALHELGEGPEYPVDILERADSGEDTPIPFRETETMADDDFDARYEDNSPEDWDTEEWADAVEDCDAPVRATLTTKTIKGNEYYYWQWSEDGTTRSEYIAPKNPKR